MTSETAAQLTTSFLVVLAWFLNHRQSSKNGKKIDDVNNIVTPLSDVVNGPLTAALKEKAALARWKADQTKSAEDEAAAAAAEVIAKARDDRH